MPPLAVGAEREEVRSSVARSLFFLLLLASLLSINGSVITLFSPPPPFATFPRSAERKKDHVVCLVCGSRFAARAASAPQDMTAAAGFSWPVLSTTLPPALHTALLRG